MRIRVSDAGEIKQKEFFINDYLGNPVVVVNQAQNIQYQTYQDPWGNLEMSVGVPTSNPEFRFTDKELDEDSDLYYFQARYYDSLSGRFLTRDSVEVEEVQTNIYQFNPYQFNRNNPVKYKDDDGEIGWDATIDVLSFSMSLKDFKDKPDLINTASLAWDTVALLPIVPGGAGVLKHAVPKAVNVVKNTIKESAKIDNSKVLKKGNEFFKKFDKSKMSNKKVENIDKYTRFSFDLKGDVPGSYTKWTKTVNKEGRTIQIYHDTYDRTEKFIHRGIKYPGPERHVK
jgi:RHS repeat-associated protein